MRKIFRRIKKGIKHYREKKAGSNGRGKHLIEFQKFKRENNGES